jgi:hypothetical protein
VAGAPGPDASGFFLSAARVEVRTEHSNRTPSALLPDPRISQDTRTLTNVTATGAEGQAPNERLLAFPGAAGAAADVPPARLTVPAADVSFADLAFGGRPYAVGLGSAIAAAQPGMVRLRGDLRLVVDGLDIRFASDQGSVTLHTRPDKQAYVQPPVQPPAGDGLLFLGDDVVHEAILDLTDAVVVLPAASAYLASAQVWGAAGDLEATTGSVTVGSHSYPMDGGQLLVVGDLHADLGRSPEGRIAVRLAGSVHSLSIDGTAVSTPTPPDGRGPAVASLTALPVALVFLHLAAGRRRFQRLDGAIDRRDYAAALVLAERLRWSPGLRQDAELAGAICLLSLGRAQEARDRLEARQRWAPSRRATRDYLLARAEAALGRLDEAAHRLAQCLRVEPSLAAQAAGDAMLAKLVRAARPPPGEAYA